MSLLRKWLAVFAVVGLLNLTGCPEKKKDGPKADDKKGADTKKSEDGKKTDEGKKADDGKKTDEPKGESKKDEPKASAAPAKPTEKLSKAVPAGVMVTEVKMPESAWAQWANSKAGDWVEYEGEPAPGFKTKTKTEVFDVGSDGLIVISTNSVGGMDLKSGIKYVFSGPDAAPADTKGEKPEITTSTDKVKVGDKELATKVTEAKVGGKVSKTWTSDEVPCGGTVKSEFDGKVLQQLVAFGRGK